MPGKVVEEALTADFVAAHPIDRVPSYEGLEALSGEGAGRAAGKLRGEVLHGGADEEIIEQLQALGYVGGAAPETAEADAMEKGAADTGEGPPPGGGVPTLLYHTNLGAVYLSKGRLDQAEVEFRRALRIDPLSPEALTGMAALFERKREPERALENLRRIVGLESRVSGTMAYRMAMLFIRLDRAADGVTFLEGLRRVAAGEERAEVGLEVALGVLYAEVERLEEAEAALLRALDRDPVSATAMQELFALYDGQNRAGELEPMLRSALARDERLAMHHNWLGLVLKRRGDMKGAEVAFRQTLEIAPDLVGAMANLGGLYMEQGRATEAVAILQQAVERDRRNIESRTNLIGALGMEGDADEARHQVDAAAEFGFMVPQFYTALGYAMHINGRREEALDAVRRALALDPRHPDALRLQSEIQSELPVVPPAPPVPP
jgi:Flp pilus assembly protein TadD